MIVLDNEPMMKHTTFRTGGPAKRFIKIESVEDILKISNDSEYSDDFLIIGNGSNLLVSDKGIDTTVIQIYDEFNSISLIDDVTIHADAGALLSKVAVFARDNSLTGRLIIIIELCGMICCVDICDKCVISTVGAVILIISMSSFFIGGRCPRTGHCSSSSR